MMNYGDFLNEAKHDIEVQLAQFHYLKRFGTLEMKVGYLFEKYPQLKHERQIHTLLISYWTYFDGLEEIDEIRKVTPAESITRTRRLIIERDRMIDRQIQIDEAEFLESMLRDVGKRFGDER